MKWTGVKIKFFFQYKFLLWIHQLRFHSAVVASDNWWGFYSVGHRQYCGSWDQLRVSDPNCFCGVCFIERSLTATTSPPVGHKLSLCSRCHCSLPSCITGTRLSFVPSDREWLKLWQPARSRGAPLPKRRRRRASIEERRSHWALLFLGPVLPIFPWLCGVAVPHNSGTWWDAEVRPHQGRPSCFGWSCQPSTSGRPLILS